MLYMPGSSPKMLQKASELKVKALKLAHPLHLIPIPLVFAYSFLLLFLLVVVVVVAVAIAIAVVGGQCLYGLRRRGGIQ